MLMPRVIVEAEEYRGKVVEVSRDIHPSIAQEGSASIDFDISDIDITSVKGRTNHALIELYNQKGYDVFKNTCLEMKKNNWFSAQDYGAFKGECAEVFLYGTVLEFIKKFNLPWKVYLSLVIPHRNGIEGNTTELDLVLVSEEMVTVFEVKSYNGNKEITGICNIKTKSQDKNIYNQNALHCESLIKLIKGFNINSNRGMKSVLFSFSEGPVHDKREDINKRLMPVLDEKTILKYLTSLTKLNEKLWKPTLVEKMDELHKSLTVEDHMNYIKEAKGGNVQ